MQVGPDKSVQPFRKQSMNMICLKWIANNGILGILSVLNLPSSNLERIYWEINHRCSQDDLQRKPSCGLV